MMDPRQLVFVSSNEEKFREIRGALESCGVAIRRAGLEVPEIQALDPADVAIYKARAAHALLRETGKHADLVLVEDTGLGLVAWAGYPGALIKWVLGAVGEAGLCRQLDAWDNRRAIARVVLCLFNGQQARLFSGEAQGMITDRPRGEYGFGWDSIFQPDGHAITYGEMPRAEKMRISMRTRALAGLRAYLQDEPDD